MTRRRRTVKESKPRKESKPSITVIQQLIAKKEKAYALLDEVNAEYEKLVKQFGAKRFDYDLGKLDENGKQYLKVVLSNNIEKAKSGEVIMVMSKFKPYSCDTSMLKNIPESLK